MLLSLAWRNIWRNRKRSFITLASILVAVLLSVLMRSMQLGMYDHMIDTVIGSYSGYVQIHQKGYWDERSIDNGVFYNSNLIDSIEKVEGVKAVLPRLESAGLLSLGELSKVISINGVELQKELQIMDIQSKVIEGRLFETPHEIVVGKTIATFFKAKVNDTLVFMSQGYHGLMAADQLVISGILDLKNPMLNRMMVLQSIEGAQDLFSAKGIATSLVVDVDQYANLNKIQRHLTEVLDAQQYEIMNWKELFPELEQTIVADDVGGILMVAILYMILIFGIFGTVLMMTQERLYEFGVLVSIGMKKIKLMMMVFIETVILSLLGVLSGIAVAYPILIWKHYSPMQFPGDQQEMIENYGFSAEIPFYIKWDLPFTHALIIFLIALVVSLYPIYVIKKLKPIKAMNE